MRLLQKSDIAMPENSAKMPLPLGGQLRLHREKGPGVPSGNPEGMRKGETTTSPQAGSTAARVAAATTDVVPVASTVRIVASTAVARARDGARRGTTRARTRIPPRPAGEEGGGGVGGDRGEAASQEVVRGSVLCGRGSPRPVNVVVLPPGRRRGRERRRGKRGGRGGGEEGT